MNTTVAGEKVLSYRQIKDLYESGCKPKSDFKIGLEYERVPIKADSGHSASYYSQNGICNFLRKFAKEENWDYITDNLEIIGLKQGHDTITLEPGCQVEFSLEPQKNISAIEQKIKKLDSEIIPILDTLGIKLLNYGITPLSTYQNIELIPKKRYHIMAKYLWGILSDVMMRETAGLQCTFDFEDEADAIKKFRIANLLTPFVTAMFANSPIRGGVDTGYKSFRALSWLNTDNERCGFAYNFKDNYNFDDYINYVMETPMLFINRDDNPLNINGAINFKEYMLGGFCHNYANTEDYLLQANLCFPEVRLRKFIEIRNHDCCGNNLQYSLLALYKGILYNNNAIEEVEKLIGNTTYNEYSDLRYSIPRLALNAKYKNYYVKDYAKELLKISEKYLKQDNSGDEKYLEYIKPYILNDKCPADEILENWYGKWDKDITKLIRYTQT